MAAGDATAADVPTKYDVVIGGKGYCFLDSVEESIPFRTHRADMGLTQPFVERQNVSNSYGDNAQDFFQTIRQRDWSLGEQQKYFRNNADGHYWMGSSVDVSTPGQVRLAQSIGTLSFAGAVRACSRDTFTSNVVTASSTNLYQIDQQGNITDKGAHGVGALPGRYACCTDGLFNYISSTTAGTVGVRKWTGAAFSTFSATGSDALAFVNNTLYGYQVTTGRLIQYDTAGAVTVLNTWKAADGSTEAPEAKLHTYGGKLLIAFRYGQESSELWVYDGTGVSRLEVFPENFFINDVDLLYGVVYVSGSFVKPSGANFVCRPAVVFFDGAQLGKLWEANDYNSNALATIAEGQHPALGVNDGRLIFTDETNGNMMAYDPSRGGVSTIGSFVSALNNGNSGQFASTLSLLVHTRNLTAGFYISGSYPSSGYVISSLIDFDSSLAKVFRGVKVEWDAASDGDGGSVDIAYQTESLTGSWTTLRSAAVSGTEYILSSITGRAIAIKVTLNKGTSTSGPTLKSLSVRGAPVMPQYRKGTYVIDCTGSAEFPREIRDGTFHALTGFAQMQNLYTAATSTTTLSVTDKLGTYTAMPDLNDPDGFDVYEVHPSVDDVAHPGSYVVRITLRGV